MLHYYFATRILWGNAGPLQTATSDMKITRRLKDSGNIRVRQGLDIGMMKKKTEVLGFAKPGALRDRRRMRVYRR